MFSLIQTVTANQRFPLPCCEPDAVTEYVGAGELRGKTKTTGGGHIYGRVGQSYKNRMNGKGCV